MDQYIFSKRLSLGLSLMGLPQLSEDCTQSLWRHHQLIQKWNQKINLTAHRDEEESLDKNFLDSLVLASLLSKTHEIMDIGSGAGFPGLVLKIALPQSKFILVESDRRKCAFLSTVIRQLSLTQIEVENIFLNPQTLVERSFQKRFDAIVSRATIPLEEIRPLVSEGLKGGGVFLGMLGKESLSEKTIHKIGLGLKIEKEIPYQLPFSKMERRILVVKKDPI